MNTFSTVRAVSLVIRAEKLPWVAVNYISRPPLSRKGAAILRMDVTVVLVRYLVTSPESHLLEILHDRAVGAIRPHAASAPARLDHDSWASASDRDLSVSGRGHRNQRNGAIQRNSSILPSRAGYDRDTLCLRRRRLVTSKRHQDLWLHHHGPGHVVHLGHEAGSLHEDPAAHHVLRSGRRPAHLLHRSGRRDQLCLQHPWGLHQGRKHPALRPVQLPAHFLQCLRHLGPHRARKELRSKRRVRSRSIRSSSATSSVENGVESDVFWGPVLLIQLFSPPSFFLFFLGSRRTYRLINICFLVGAIMPIPTYYLTRRFPKSFLRYVNWPLIFAGISVAGRRRWNSHNQWFNRGNCAGWMVSRFEAAMFETTTHILRIPPPPGSFSAGLTPELFALQVMHMKDSYAAWVGVATGEMQQEWLQQRGGQAAADEEDDEELRAALRAAGRSGEAAGAAPPSQGLPAGAIGVEWAVAMLRPQNASVSGSSLFRTSADVALPMSQRIGELASSAPLAKRFSDSLLP